MIDLKFNSRSFCRLGQSGSICGMAIPAAKKSYPIKVVSADMSVAAGLDRFKKLYPNDFYNVGIAEQNMIGVAAGLASEGFKSIAIAQAAFISMRSFEQVRQFMGYMKYPIITIGINSGFALTFFGNTHYAIEDIALMRSIPGMLILSPADAGAAVKCFESALEMGRPTYIRLTRGLMPPIVYDDDYEYDPLQWNDVYVRGNDITIFAIGSMVYQSLKAADLLNGLGINCKVVDAHCVKPIDKEAVKKACQNAKLLVSIEEHTVIGGLGSAISEELSMMGKHPRLLKLGVKDCFSEVGDYNYLLEMHRLTPQLIAEDIKNNL